MSDGRNLSLRHQSLLNTLLNRCLDKAILAEGTNANTFKTTAAVDFCIKGQMYTKAATDNIAFATAGAAFTAQPDLSTAYYLVVIDSAGTVTVRQGVASTASVTQANSAIGRPGDIPFCPADRAVLGVIKVVTSGATFTPAVTDLGAAGVTDTYYDLSCIPPNGASDLV